MSTDDRTTAMLLQYLREHMDKEPPRPDLDVHTGSHLELVAREYDRWERTRGGLYALLGARLVNEHLDQTGSQSVDQNGR